MAMTPSPAKCSITPPAASIAGHDRGPERVEHREDLGRRAGLAERREPGEVGEQRRSPRAPRPPAATPGASPADALGDDRRQVRPERRIEPAQLVGRSGEQRDLVGSVAPSRRSSASTRSIEPPVAPRRRRPPRSRRHASGRSGRASASRYRPPNAPVSEPLRRYSSRAPSAISRERGEHQDVPFPPAQLPVATDDDRDHGLGQQDQRDRDG